MAAQLTVLKIQCRSTHSVPWARGSCLASTDREHRWEYTFWNRDTRQTWPPLDFVYSKISQIFSGTHWPSFAMAEVWFVSSPLGQRGQWWIVTELREVLSGLEVRGNFSAFHLIFLKIVVFFNDNFWFLQEGPARTVYELTLLSRWGFCLLFFFLNPGLCKWSILCLFWSLFF